MTINKKQAIIISAVSIVVIAIFTVLGIILDRKNAPEELTTEADSVIFEEVVSTNETIEDAIEEESSEPVVTTEVSTTERSTKPVEVSTNVHVDGYFDVPLSTDLQVHIFSLCEQYNVSPALVIAMIEKESTYNPEAVNYNGTCFGLMQVYEYHHTDRMARLGVTDLFDPYQNVTVGIDILAELYSTGKSTAWVLMAYNGGHPYADAKISTGTISYYASSVMSRAESLGG